MMRVAYLGPGTFSEESVRYFLGESFTYVPYRLISDVFMSTVNGNTDLSVIPVENTIDGSVSLHLDWLIHEVDLPIQAEWVYPIEMNLIGLESTRGQPIDYTTIHKVISHPVAISQCRLFLREHLPHAEISESSSTAEGVKITKQLNDPHVVAIGPAVAAQLYGLPILANQIQDHQNNVTRFVMIGSKKPELRNTTAHKTTVLVTLPEDYPGALHQVLSAFAWRRINLSKIESRPTKKRLGSYFFYIDIEQSLDTTLLPAAIEEIKAIGCQVRLMGSYPSFSMES